MNPKNVVACLIIAVLLSIAETASAKSTRHGHPHSHLSHPQTRHAASFHPRQASRPAPEPIIIAIDAGHGGKDTGAIGASGVLEKEVAYAIARKLETLVRAEPGMRPVMVRKGDTFIGLGQRAEIARRAGADLFISVHADAHTDDEAKGSAVFILSPRRVASDSDAVHTLHASGSAAGKILGELRKRQCLHYAHVQKARFAVLKSPDMPSMLIETGFVTNPEEERRLASPPYQQKVARAIFNGIRAHFRAEPQRSKTGKPVLLADRQ
jgi:N-acetylmuramoyl-L-alanine amidase